MWKKCVISFGMIVLLSLLSCEKEISMDLPIIDETMVLFSLLQENKPISVELSKTHSPFVDVQIPDDSACIIIQNGITADTLQHLQDGQYLSQLVASSYTKYEILAYVHGELQAYSSDVVPSVIGIEEISCSLFTDFVGTNEDNEKYSSFSIVINDKPNETNYYEIQTDILYSNGETKSIRCWCNDLIVEAEGINDYYPSTVLFSDKLLEQSCVQLTVFYQPPYYVDNNQLIDPNYKIILHCRNVSESYFKYKEGLAAHLSGQQYDFWNAAGDPVPMYSNIEGGFGIFSSYSEVIDTICKAY